MAKGSRKAPPGRVSRPRKGVAFYRLVPKRLRPRDLLSPTRRLESRMFAGVTGRNRGVTNLFFALQAVRALRQSARRRPEVLVCDHLDPGQSISVRTAKPPGRGMGRRERQQGLPS